LEVGDTGGSGGAEREKADVGCHRHAVSHALPFMLRLSAVILR
jgi:hypothetical protein